MSGRVGTIAACQIVSNIWSDGILCQVVSGFGCLSPRKLVGRNWAEPTEGQAVQLRWTGVKDGGVTGGGGGAVAALDGWIQLIGA